MTRLATDEAARLRDWGSQRALFDDLDGWGDAADAVIRELARCGFPFTADDVWVKAGPPPTPQMAGGPFVRAARAGVIRRGGFQRATRISRRGGFMTEWIGVS
jgi:hypothetical protein